MSPADPVKPVVTHPCPTCGQPFEVPWRFNFDAAALCVGGELIRFSPKEAQLFGLLAKRPGYVVRWDAIIMLLWDRDEPADPQNNIDVMLSRIRRKLAGTPLGIRVHKGEGASLYVNTGEGR